MNDYVARNHKDCTTCPQTEITIITWSSAQYINYKMMCSQVETKNQYKYEEEPCSIVSLTNEKNKGEI